MKKIKKKYNASEIRRIDYNSYKLKKTEIMKIFIQTACICIAIIYLFYEQYSFLFFTIPLPFFAVIYARKKKIKNRKKALNYQFKDMLTSLSVSLQAGHSVESAIRICRRDMERLYEREADILKELMYMETQQGISVTIEELFFDLGERSGLEDIENFASVFGIAKRTGGDMSKVIQRVARMMADKVDVSKEIEATLAAKKSEQLIMSLMPAGIILYLKITSPGFLDVLYGNIFGIAAMSVCLGLYLAAYWMGCKIVEIEV